MSEARLLRVLSGPHLGAEMSLRPGRYAIGTDENCDIVLSDSRLAARHAFLIVSDDQVSIEPGDGAVTVDGAKVDGRVVVADFKPVLMGATTLALGPAKAPWPDIALTRPEPPPANGVDGDAPGAPAAEPAAAEAADAGATPASPEPLPAAAADDSAARGVRRRWSRAAVAAAVLALVLATGAFGVHLWNADREVAVRQTAAAPTPQAQVQAIVDQLGFGSALQVSEPSGTGDDRVVVQGYLDTEAQRRELISALQPMLGRVDLRVWSTALLEESIGQALAGMRLQLTVSEVEDGKVTLTGVLPASISKQRLEQTLRRDVPGIASIDLQVVSIAEAMNWLRDQIAGIGIPEKTLSIARQGESLVIDGRLATSLQGAWHDLVSAFGQRYGAELSLADDVTFAVAAAEPELDVTPLTFDFSIRAINLGPPAYITLDSNTKYLVGSRLDNGMILEQIMPNGMVLRDGATRHLVEIAQDSGRVTNVRKLETD